LQRRVAAEFGNDPLNWTAQPATVSRTNQHATVASPIITAQPQGQTVIAGDSVTFSVLALGTAPLSYRWQHNGTDLFTATNAVLLISNVQVANSGSYRVWVTNAAGLICSYPASLSVFNPPVITAHPLGMSVAVGGNAMLQVAAAGTAPLGYQWYFNDSTLPAATSTSLTLTGVGPEDAGTYRVVVTNSVGMTMSYPAILKVTGTDTDADGIPDSWMMQNFGHATGLAYDLSRAEDDRDGDHMSNLQEYWAGTGPLDPESCLELKILEVNSAAGRVQLSFTAIASVDYTLAYSDNPSAGQWHKLADVPADPTTRTVTLSDPGASAAPIRFYRVVTPIQPDLDLDTDGDGIPDAWMIQHFGHPTSLASDRSRAGDDADADGMSNRQEYLAGTGPLDSQSNLKLYIQGPDSGTGWPQVSFVAMQNVSYTLQYADSLTFGPWHKLTDVPAAPTTRLIRLNDFGAASVTVRFFRVVTPIQP
jgi:hypothetical protein